MARLHRQISFYISFALSGRFRVGFGVGHDRALTFRDRPGYLNSEPPHHVSVAM